MKVLFFYPPVANITQPYLSIPTLISYLKQFTVHDIAAYDLNIDTSDELLTPERLRRAYRWCYHHLRKPVISDKDFSTTSVKQQFIRSALPPSIEAAEHITDAKSVFKTSRFYDSAWYLNGLNTILGSYFLLSARYFPTVLSYQSLSMRYRCDSSADLTAAVTDHTENPFIEIFSSRIDQILKTGALPELICISIGYYEQFIPGLTLAKVLKEKLPRAHITLGGSMISALYGKPLPPHFFDMFDSLIFFEGELPLLKLTSALETKSSLRSVPNLCFREEGRVIDTPLAPPIDDINSLPVADFSIVSHHSYLSPEPILPIAAARGCYWRRCTFCSRQHLQHTFRQRHPRKIVEEMIELQEKHGACAFFFVDECIPPGILDAIADNILDCRLQVHWSCYARFEKQFLHAQLCKKLYSSGLRMLYFGLESACQRILDLMQKGTQKAYISRILQNTADAGIMNMILYFVGFPTETREEALESLEFILGHQDYITYALAGRFMLEEHSPIFESPQDFGISEIFPLSEKSDLGIIYGYRTKSGMNNREIEQVQEYINQKTQHLHSLELLNRSHLLLLGKKYLKSIIG